MVLLCSAFPSLFKILPALSEFWPIVELLNQSEGLEACFYCVDIIKNELQ